jgi:protein TonB
LPLIRTLAAVCPLLGLLGTVVGMITVFQMMGSVGTGSPRIVAAGVSTAMVTTMAGMVGALSGVFPAAMLARRARAHLHALQSAERKPDGFKDYVGRKQPFRVRRLLIAPFAAVLLTFALVLGMEQMILIGRLAVSEAGAGFAVDFIRVERDETIARREKPEKPPEPTEQPQFSEPQPVSSFAATALRIQAVAPPVTMNTASGGIGGGVGFVATDGEFLPIVKVAPIYPPRAAARGLEGFVVVEYTVTASGDTKDIVVLESSSNLFNNSAIDSVLKYKYRPRVIDGTPVEVTGVTTLIYFELEELEEEQ